MGASPSFNVYAASQNPIRQMMARRSLTQCGHMTWFITNSPIQETSCMWLDDLAVTIGRVLKYPIPRQQIYRLEHINIYISMLHQLQEAHRSHWRDLKLPIKCTTPHASIASLACCTSPLLHHSCGRVTQGLRDTINPFNSIQPDCCQLGMLTAKEAPMAEMFASLHGLLCSCACVYISCMRSSL